MNCSFLVNANLSSQLVLTDEPNWKVLPKKILLLFVLELTEFLKPFFLWSLIQKFNLSFYQKAYTII